MRREQIAILVIGLFFLSSQFGFVHKPACKSCYYYELLNFAISSRRLQFARAIWQRTLQYCVLILQNCSPQNTGFDCKMQKDQQLGNYSKLKPHPKPYPNFNPNTDPRLQRTLYLNFKLSCMKTCLSSITYLFMHIFIFLSLLEIIIYMKKFLDSDWLRGVQFYFKLHCMQCKLTKRKQLS